MDNSINTRFQSIINDCFKGNKRAFANAIGVSPTVVENVVGKRGGKPSYDVLYAVCANANIAAEWLLIGEGPMLKGAEAVTEAAPPSPPIQAEGSPMADALLAQLAEKDRQIAQLLALMSSITNK